MFYQREARAVKAMYTLWFAISALELSSLPKRLLVVGAGYIGLELGSVYSALGSQVTVVEQDTRLLAGIDSDLSAILYQRLKKNFYELRLGVSVQNIQDTGDALLVTLVDDAKQYRWADQTHYRQVE